MSAKFDFYLTVSVSSSARKAMKSHHWIRIALSLAAACLPCLNAAYFDSAQELVAQHRRSVDRLQAPAALVRAALFAGGAFYVTGSDAGWIAEATGRHVQSQELDEAWLLVRFDVATEEEIE